MVGSDGELRRSALTNQSQSPTELVIDLTSQFMVSRSIQMLAEIGVADALGDTPLDAAALAAKTGTNAEALHRVMRLATTHGVFALVAEKFSHTPASRLLRSDHPQSLRAWARMMGAEINWSAYGKFDHTLRTGKPARELLTNGNFFSDYLPKHPEVAKLFDESMTSAAHRRISAVLEVYDFSPYKTIADIGGGRGHLIRAVLEKTPSSNGILFDLPHAAEPAHAFNIPHLTIRTGDFFKTPLPVADAYLLMMVIHDWSDEESVRILQAVRRAAPKDAKLILLERSLAGSGEPEIGVRMDIHMLVALTGKERTREEFAKLYSAAGFKLDRVIETAGGVSILEGSVA
jgi:hypothetical protein